MSISPIAVCEDPDVHEGPALMAGVGGGPSLASHRRQYGDLPRPTLDDLLHAVGDVGILGRGGAAFPFAIKLRTAAGGARRPVVVVNLSEGEPASSKDSALARTRPHLVLDGALATARALGARQVHVVVPGDRPLSRAAMEAAMDERQDRRVRLVRHVASPRFVAGQARAVLQLMAGRPNLPVTAWTPEAVTGHRSRPTLLSNAETWAHVGHLLHRGMPVDGTAEEPGTTLLTLRLPESHVEVREVAYGSPLAAVLPAHDTPVLLGGFHGTWTRSADVRHLRVSVPGLRAAGCQLGAGVLLAVDDCPVAWTQRIVAYLAGQTARRCGPCLNGLPVLSRAVSALDDGAGTRRVEQLSTLVEGRGACAHPDGTVRLVRSLLTAYPDEVDRHAVAQCAWTRPRAVRRLRSVAS
jgi:NADH:ubiquinone oxidoreductase subunit F (NADH-binding)